MTCLFNQAFLMLMALFFVYTDLDYNSVDAAQILGRLSVSVVMINQATITTPNILQMRMICLMS